MIYNLIRRLVPRSLRNALRRPSVTFSRILDKARYLVGKVAVASVTETITVNCHPMCVGEFSIFRNDVLQCAEMRGFVAAMRPSLQFLDIGAHWGVFTLVAMRLGGAGSRAVCIEPSNEAAKVLGVNVHLNQRESQVVVVNSACGDKVGELRMLTSGAGGADYFVVPPDDRPDAIIVPQVTADAVCETRSFKPTHVKIDVEGFEEEVLLGAQNILRGHRPHLFLELHGDLIRRRGRKPETVIDLLEKLGYTQWRSVEGDLPVGRRELASKGFNDRLSMIPD